MRGLSPSDDTVAVLVLDDLIPELTLDATQAMLGELGSELSCAGIDLDYWRIQFKGNRGVAFWDGRSGQGICLLAADEREIESLDLLLPAWYGKLELLEGRFERRVA